MTEAAPTPTQNSGEYTGFPRNFLQLLVRERTFLIILAVGFLIAGVAYPYPQVAMWVGFAFAGYAVVANDSIQTIGTFIASNKHRPWWVLWLFIGGIMLATLGYSWFANSGDVTRQLVATGQAAVTSRAGQFGARTPGMRRYLDWQNGLLDHDAMAAARFVEFCSGPEGRAVFEQAGFTVLP